MSLSVSIAKESLEKLKHCLLAVSAWMTRSKLKLNPNETEFILIWTKLQREKLLHNFRCLILGHDTNPSPITKNLGVVFDSSLNFRKTTNLHPDLLVRPKCSKYLHSTNSNKCVVPRLKTKTGSRSFPVSGPA